jgi:serine/threonine-protein kinase RsbW
LKEYNIIISDRNEISKIETLIFEINSEFKADELKYVNFLIAVTEACVNAIVHGNKNNPSKKVYVNLSYDETIFCVKVKDEGDGFDIKKIPDPTIDENLYKESGRGLFLIRSLVDRVEVVSNTTGTLIVMTIVK